MNQESNEAYSRDTFSAKFCQKLRPSQSKWGNFRGKKTNPGA